MFSSNKDKKGNRNESVHHSPPDEEVQRERILSKYETELETIVKNSIFLKETPSRNVPRFGMDEIEAGKVLGVGGFCAVREVANIRLDPNLSHLQPEFQVKDSEFHESETRMYMSGNFFREKEARYAIKVMKTKFEKESQRYRGMLDLAIEAEYLSHLNHPNIIKLRGTLFCESSVKESGYFLVLDRLYETLDEKIEVIWPKEYKGMTGPFAFIGNDKSKSRRLFFDRLVVAHDLSTVFRYLHEKRIVYRDLKPENIGFDIRGDVKLFDFGLCKELPRSKKKNEVFKLTVKTGSIPYMSPEVMMGQKYNEKADVFSFGILLWEIFSLKLPFQGFNRYDFIEKVCKKELRPSTNIKCPSIIKQLMQEMWDHDAKKRPEFTRTSNVIRGELNDISEGLNASIRDRTSHLMNRSRNSMHMRAPK